MTSPALDFSASLTSHRQLIARLKSFYLAFSQHGGCNLSSLNFKSITLNFTFITLKFTYHFMAHASLLHNAIPQLLTLVPYLPPRATWYQQTMVFTFISRTFMKILKYSDSSMNAFVGLLVTPLPQAMTSSCSIFCLWINYLSMWDPCFWLYGCFISLKAAAVGTCFWEVQVYHRNLISLIIVTCLGISVGLCALTSLYEVVGLFFFPQMLLLFIYHRLIYLQ